MGLLSSTSPCARPGTLRTEEEVRRKAEVAMITGAASGIGKEIARTFLAAGAKVAIVYVNQCGAEVTARELSETGGSAVGLAADVTNPGVVVGAGHRPRSHQSRSRASGIEHPPLGPWAGRREDGSEPWRGRWRADPWSPGGAALSANRLLRRPPSGRPRLPAAIPRQARCRQGSPRGRRR
ncbi:MAG: SDR family NAD(P)-dependent oxidoreductase [Nitrososphaerales archaeon]